jgi:biotin transport system substrate-specific component
MQTSITDTYFKKRQNFFHWRYNQSIINKTILAFSMACITGILAQVIIPIPWTPVPITGQTFSVLLSGVILGRYWGGISQILYVGIGILGIPWFAGFTSGYETIIGASGGYLIGFILAALFLGNFTDKHVKARGFIPMFVLMLFANFILIYLPGLFQLGAWMYFVKGTETGIWTLLWMGVIPFLAGDLVKIGGSAALAKAITPKESFNGDRKV